MALSRRGIHRQTANEMADVQQSSLVARNPVLPDGLTHLSRPTFHTSTSSLGPTCNVYSPLIGDAIRLLHILPSTNETLGYVSFILVSMALSKDVQPV